MALPVTVTSAVERSDHFPTRLGPFANGSDLFAFAVDVATNRVRAHRSQDGGLTWAEVDAGTTRATSSTAGDRSADAAQLGTTVYVAAHTSASALSVYPFSLTTATWGTAIASPTITLAGASVVDIPAPKTYSLTALTSGGADYLVVLYQGATELVMSTNYRRVKLHVRNLTAGTWAGPYDVHGSANTPPANTLPGVQTHYEARAALTAGDRVLLWYTAGGSVLRCRAWTGAAFAAGVQITTGLTNLRNTGYPATYARAGGGTPTTGAALPYALLTPDEWRVARLDDATGAATVGNWRTELIAGLDTLGTANAGAGALLGDGERLWAFVVPATDQIHYAEDAGGGVWGPLRSWKRGQEVFCAGLSVAPVPDAVGVLYHDQLGDPTAAQPAWDALLPFGHQTASPSSRAQAFRLAAGKTLKAVRVWLAPVGTPTAVGVGAVEVAIRADASGAPHASTNLAYAQVDASLIAALAGGSWAVFRFANEAPLSSAPVALSAATTYWLVVHNASATADAANHYQVGYTQADAVPSLGMAFGTTAVSSITWTAQAAGAGDLAYYLYTSEDTDPERLRYDRLVVLAAAAPRAVGLTEGATVDLGDAPPDAVEVIVTVGAGADPAGSVAVTVEGSWDQGAWTALAEAGPFAAAGVEDRVTVAAPPRYLRAVTATATAESASAVAGVEAPPPEGV